jgi:hypothetical protein
LIDEEDVVVVQIRKRGNFTASSSPLSYAKKYE